MFADFALFTRYNNRRNIALKVTKVLSNSNKYKYNNIVETCFDKNKKILRFFPSLLPFKFDINNFFINNR